MTRSIHTLRRQIKSLRDKNWKWEDICLHLKILQAEVNESYPDGLPDTGMAYAIANGVKRRGVLVEYEPSKPDVRERLGLPVICKECKRRRVVHSKNSKPAKAKLPWETWWSKLPREKKDEVKKFVFEIYS